MSTVNGTTLLFSGGEEIWVKETSSYTLRSNGTFLFDIPTRQWTRLDDLKYERGSHGCGSFDVQVDRRTKIRFKKLLYSEYFVKTVRNSISSLLISFTKTVNDLARLSYFSF